MKYNYICPLCSRECSVPQEMVGYNVTCPLCNKDFFAAIPQLPQTAAQLGAPKRFPIPKKIPFFKSGRRKLLEERVWQLNYTHGFIDDAAEEELKQTAVSLGLQKEEASELLKRLFLTEMEPIKRRMETSFVMTDDDVAELERLKKRFNVRLTLDGNAELFRKIYLIESKHQLPTPVNVPVMLDAGEGCYYSIDTTWHQSRVQNRGYSGTSISIPTGITGVRFRFGGYTPNRVEEMTPLSRGTLFVTSQRLLFSGESRSATINIRKIIDGHMYSDCVKIEKNTGKPDLFSMNAAEARYVLSLVGVIRETSV